MTENILKKLLKQVSMYFSSGVIVTLAGFITFPIWTRVFTEAEYGMMSLALMTTGLIVVFSKLGISQAALRSYSEFKENKRDLGFTYYYSTAFLGILVVSLIIALVFLLIVEFYSGIHIDAQYMKILRILPLIIITDSHISIFLLFLRVEQNVKLFSTITIARRYSKLLMTLLFALVLKLGLFGFFLGYALNDALFALMLLIKFLQQGKIRPKCFSISLFKESISFGLPLIGFELSALLLMTGDRYMLQYFLGAEAVGIYSASSNLNTYLVDFFSEALKLAATPIFISIWEKKGKEETQNFLSSVLKIYLMIGIPIIFAIFFIGRDLIVILASKKFEEGSIVLPFIVIGYVIHKANFLYGAGLYLKKKTGTLLIITFCSAIINVILNIWFIPWWGILGAAITTLIAFVFELILLVKISYKIINIKFPIYGFIKYTAISIVMVGVMLSINNLGTLYTAIRIIAGFLIYLCGILLFEKQVRSKAGILFHKVFARLASSLLS